MTLEAFYTRLAGLSIWRRGGQRAPHKPLLLLLAMGSAARGESRLIPFARIEKSLTGLLRHFGPPRKVHHPEFPFGRLVSDGLWEIPGVASLRRTQSGDLYRRDLIDHGVAGGLPEPLYRLLAADPQNAQRAARRILNGHFPVSMHQHILEAVGLRNEANDEQELVVRTDRDPHFRVAVLTAYERRCAICDFDLRLEDDLLGLEAAHIRWHSHGGPDQVTNGLALCTFHHGAFDRGAIGLERTAGSADYRVVVSQYVHGTSAAVRWLLDYHGRLLRPPQARAGEPDAAHVAWHGKQVFRAPAREIQG